MKKVLVIDDCGEFREVVSDLLDDAGYQVVAVSTPEEAEKQCKETHFDTILCDLVMPLDPEEGIDDEDGDSAMVGLHTINTLSKKYPSIPIIAVSGQVEGQPLQAMQTFGASATLAKPFGRDKLIGTIEGAISRVMAAKAG